MLGKWGLKCHFVANGNEALDALREATYDLILMDCQMPELDGYEATRIIRKSDTLPSHIPIIALTANVGQGDEEKCIQAGMNSYLAKPVDRGLLEKALISFLSSQKSLINQATLAQFDELQMEGQPDILIEIIESFLKTSPKRVDQIVSFLESGDFEGSAREAHSLKSSANTLGAEELGKLCQRIEDRAELDDNAIVRSRIQSLQQLYSRSKAELIEIRAKRMSGSENPAA
jgi:CheY-like chemotaxis protein